MKSFNTLLVVLLLLASQQQLFSIRYPIAPKTPKEPYVNDELNTTKTDKQSPKKVKKALKAVRVMITLGSGDTLYGTVDLPEKISFPHYKNGFFYHKTVKIQAIKSIAILQFNKSILATNKLGTTYEFKPNKYLIILNNGSQYITKKSFHFLSKVKLHTEDGLLVLFSFFANTFHKKRGWSEISGKSPDYHLTNPHPKSIHTIKFLQEN